MSSISIAGDTSGSVILTVPAAAGSSTATFPAATGNVPISTNSYTGGMVPNALLYRLNADLAGANVNTAQSIFGVGVTLSASTVYVFESVYTLAKTAGTTSHTMSFSFGGTATLNNISYVATYVNTNAAPPTGTTSNIATSNTASAITVMGAVTTATNTFFMSIKGSFSVNAGGTFIPQYTLSAAPGGAYSTTANSYIMIYPIGASGSNVSIGTWA